MTSDVEKHRKDKSKPQPKLLDSKDLQKNVQEMERIHALILKHLVKGTDYDSIFNKDKDVLLKPGAEKICRLFGCMAEYEEIEKTEDFVKGFFHHKFKCKFVRIADGQVLSEGYGSANTKERTFASKAALDQDNNALKRAKKRSLTDAALGLGFSGLFTQDLDDDGPDSAPLKDMTAQKQALREKINQTIHNSDLTPQKKSDELKKAFGVPNQKELWEMDVKDIEKGLGKLVKALGSKKLNKGLSPAKVKKIMEYIEKDQISPEELRSVLASMGYKKIEEVKDNDYDKVLMLIDGVITERGMGMENSDLFDDEKS